MKKMRAPKRLEARISDLQHQIVKLERQLGEAKADRKNPLSREFPSAIEGHANLGTTLTRELENAQGDLELLRQIASGAVALHREKFLRQQLPEFSRMRENVMNIIANMQSELAGIERAKQLLR